MGSSRKAMVVLACVSVLMFSAGYIVRQLQAALREPTERERIAARLTPPERAFYERMTTGGMAVHPTPELGCNDAARAALKVIEGAPFGTPPREYIEAAERALIRDPDCAAAAYVLVRAHAKLGTHRSLRDRWQDRADAHRSDAVAQLMASYYLRDSGNGEEAARYLERAEAVRPRLPLLHLAWGYHYRYDSDPLDFGKAIAHFEREVEHTGSVRAMAELAQIYSELSDHEQVELWCDRYYEDYPESRLELPALACMKSAIAQGDAAAIATQEARFWDTMTVGPACQHSQLASFHLAAGRLESAIAEADAAIAAGCESEGFRFKAAALARQQQYEAALEVLEATPVLSRGQRSFGSLLLALNGETEAARRVLSAPAANDTERLLAELLAQTPTREMLQAALHPDELPTTAAGRLAAAGCNHVRHMMFASGAKLVDRALALDPAEPSAWGCKVWLAMIDEQPQRAIEEGQRALALGVSSGTLENNLGVASRAKISAFSTRAAVTSTRAHPWTT